MKEINLRDYYPFYTNDLTVEVPDEVAVSAPGIHTAGRSLPDSYIPL